MFGWGGGCGGPGAYEEGGDCDAGADAEDGCHLEGVGDLEGALVGVVVGRASVGVYSFVDGVGGWRRRGMLRCGCGWE